MIRLLFITDEAFFFNNVWCMVYIFCIPPHERDGELTFGVFLCDGGKPKKRRFGLLSVGDWLYVRDLTARKQTQKKGK